MKLLVLDNYDSFTYNLVHLLRTLGVTAIEVHRNDRITVEEASRFDRIVLSPGPGIPLEAGIMPALVKALSPTHPILGVCLGHQCIGEVFGGKLINMGSPVHGKATAIRLLEHEHKLFKGVSNGVKVGRYHSWLVAKEHFPDCLKITAEDDLGQVMALCHKQFPVTGVQFHPESVLTEFGETMMRNWLEG